MKKIILSLSMLLTSTFAVDCNNAFIKAVVSMISMSQLPQESMKIA